ncbi:unnamed protein product [Symbiodinium sp. CCMP2592]|nr:unnamed protein product [Symbiodinium sp. CCMP2592]
MLDHHVLMQWKDPARTGTASMLHAKLNYLDPDLRELKRILLAAWFPDRLHELDRPEADAPEPAGDGEDYDLEESGLEAEEDQDPVAEEAEEVASLPEEPDAEEVASLPEEPDVAGEAMEVDGAGDGLNVDGVPTVDDVMVLSDEETNTPPHKPMRMHSLSGSKLDVPVGSRLQLLKMQLDAVK